MSSQALCIIASIALIAIARLTAARLGIANEFINAIAIGAALLCIAVANNAAGRHRNLIDNSIGWGFLLFALYQQAFNTAGYLLFAIILGCMLGFLLHVLLFQPLRHQHATSIQLVGYWRYRFACERSPITLQLVIGAIATALAIIVMQQLLLLLRVSFTDVATQCTLLFFATMLLWQVCGRSIPIIGYSLLGVIAIMGISYAGLQLQYAAVFSFPASIASFPATTASTAMYFQALVLACCTTIVLPLPFMFQHHANDAAYPTVENTDYRSDKDDTTALPCTWHVIFATIAILLLLSQLLPILRDTPTAQAWQVIRTIIVSLCAFILLQRLLTIIHWAAFAHIHLNTKAVSDIPRMIGKILWAAIVLFICIAAISNTTSLVWFEYAMFLASFGIFPVILLSITIQRISPHICAAAVMLAVIGVTICMVLSQIVPPFNSNAIVTSLREYYPYFWLALPAYVLLLYGCHMPLYLGMRKQQQPPLTELHLPPQAWQAYADYE